MFNVSINNNLGLHSNIRLGFERSVKIDLFEKSKFISLQDITTSHTPLMV